MSKDLRKLFEEDNTNSENLISPGHTERFLERLEKELPQPKKSHFVLWKVAATILIVLGISIFYINKNEVIISKDAVVEKSKRISKSKTFSLGDLSPDLKKVEDYYVSTINFELSKIELNKSNKDLIDSYLEQIEVLDKEYARLNIELNEVGPNDQTISALIENLQLRLELLQKLKTKLNELKSSKNEQDQII
ncbi:hypothetical protein [Aurantibacter sp.]|uniref:hypothetical protein n=1 Tax=Aurantibacter sp. TaxID=2807103 RepID=UPI0032644B3C